MNDRCFTLDVSYSTLAVFEPDLGHPFNDWRPAHWAQGFSWRPESVSFRTLEGHADHEVTVRVAEAVDVRDDAVRAIVVPFAVGPKGRVEVASISDGAQMAMPAGDYGLLFETGRSNGGYWCWVTFVPGWSGEAQVLRADDELSPSSPLLLHAEPA